jgi:hypothetical protein
MMAASFEFVRNSQTARTLGFTGRLGLLVVANEKLGTDPDCLFDQRWSNVTRSATPV